MKDIDRLQKICRLVRYGIIKSTSQAGSGHPSSSLSAVELMTVLFFKDFLKYDLKNPKNPANDRVIFSKGHAAPLLYSLYYSAGIVSFKELLSLRKFDSVFEGHPTPRFSHVETATGSLGQGLSVGLGIALGTRLRNKERSMETDQEDRNKNKVYVLLGDSEIAEGQIWEAMEIAGYYKLNNLIAIADINRLGQRGETMLGWDLKTYAKRAESFGWNTIILDNGHDLNKIIEIYKQTIEDKGLKMNIEDRGLKIENSQSSNFHHQNPSSTFHHQSSSNKPTIIIAKTVKGKGVSFLENQDGWHGKVIPKDRLQEALNELGDVDLNIRGKISLPQNQISNIKNQKYILNVKNIKQKLSIYNLGSNYSTREAYGDALTHLGQVNNKIVVLDAETSNSTFAEKFAKKFPHRFFEMFIAEQNMVSSALGFSRQEFIPFISTFAAFFTRAFDQIRMCQYSFDKSADSHPSPNLKFCGSHCGVSIGPDGPSQMGLEDISMFRSILNSVIFYPSDAISAFKLTQIMAEKSGLFYLRTTREKTPLIYRPDEQFKIGGSKILKHPKKSKALVITAGITVHEALKAYEQLIKEEIEITIVDLYSVKPIDQSTIQQLAISNKNIIVAEDHYPAGGIGEAVRSALNNEAMKQCSNFIHLFVKKLPHSGTLEELLAFEQINSQAIINAVKSCL